MKARSVTFWLLGIVGLYLFQFLLFQFLTSPSDRKTLKWVNVDSNDKFGLNVYQIDSNQLISDQVSGFDGRIWMNKNTMNLHNLYLIYNSFLLPDNLIKISSIKRENKISISIQGKPVSIYFYQVHSAFNISTIYQSIDSISNELKIISNLYPDSIIFLMIPSQFLTHSKDLIEIAFFLILKYFISQHDNIYLFSPRQNNMNSKFLSCQFPYSDSHTFLQGKSLEKIQINKYHPFVLTTPKHTYHITTLQRQCEYIIFTRKYKEQCLPPPMKLYPILITGLGGTGTHYLANTLHDLDFFLNHERIGFHGSVSWFYSVNDRLLGLPYPYGELDDSTVLSPRFETIIHVHRDPFSQISSFTSHSKKSYVFVQRLMSLLRSESLLPQTYLKDALQIDFKESKSKCPRGDPCNLYFSVLSWIYFNNFVASYADIQFSIRNDTLIFNEVCSRLWQRYEVSNKLSCIQQRQKYLQTWSFQRFWNRFWHYQTVHTHLVHQKHLSFNYQNINDLDPYLNELIKKTEFSLS